MSNGNVENVRLHRGVLGLLDIAAATMANIGPAMSFYFGFAFIAGTAGVASPLVILLAGIAIALLVIPFRSSPKCSLRLVDSSPS